MIDFILLPTLIYNFGFELDPLSYYSSYSGYFDYELRSLFGDKNGAIVKCLLLLSVFNCSEFNYYEFSSDNYLLSPCISYLIVGRLAFTLSKNASFSELILFDGALGLYSKLQ